MTRIALWCVWAAYTTAESLEVAACAAEPPEEATSAAMSSEAMMPATVPPEETAYAAEPHKMGTSVSAPCAVVAPSDTLLVHELSPWRPAVKALSVLPWLRGPSLNSLPVLSLLKRPSTNS
ncbi:hypothetical protein M9458_019378, partial [Cirrhinus mrigala]